MEKIFILDKLIEILCRERNETPPELPQAQKADYFRSLCNIRPPTPISDEFLKLQDEYLSEQTKLRGVKNADALNYRDGIALWQGDITRLNAGAIVNACNSGLLGCFVPLHNCIDNIIHSNAGVQVRLDCLELTKGKKEPNGSVRVTKGYNLPCEYIFHTVGPIVDKMPTEKNIEDLKKCYLSCIDKAELLGLSSVAFCCLSTGVYRFPKKDACSIAVNTVRNRLKQSKSGLRVIFDVFTDEDRVLYEKELSGKD